MIMKLKFLALVAAVAMSVPVVPGAVAAPLVKPEIAVQMDVQNVMFGRRWGAPPVWTPPRHVPSPGYTPYPRANGPMVTSPRQVAPKPGYDINGGKGQLKNTFNDHARQQQLQQQEALRQLFNALSRGRY